MNKYIAKCFGIVLFLLFYINIFAQLEEPVGTIPPGIKWRQINTDTVRVVFPEGLEKRALRLTNLVHYLAKNNKRSIGELQSKIDIFLINTGAGSNGFVRPAPYHSKFYTMPPQHPFAGTVDWFDLLGVHEYRHVMQMNNSKHGITSLGKYFFGETIWAALMFAAVPNWFWEGDAVQQETALTYSGRGRLPLFKTRFLTIMDINKPFGYEKMRCGSYNNYIPDHYALGYQMVNYGRRKFGNDIWASVFKEAVSYKGIVWPFSVALKRKTGLSTKNMYSKVVDYYKNDESNMPFFIAGIPDIYKSKTYKNNPSFYNSPHFISKKNIIAIKSSFDEATKFVEIDIENKEERDILPVSYNFGDFDADGQKIVWSEINSDPRWNYVSYSNIYCYDLSSKEIDKLSSDKNYLSPSISPRGDRICVFEASENLIYRILILNSKTGEVMKALDNPDNYFYSYLDWIDTTNIVAIAKHNNKNAIVKINIENSSISELVPFTYTTLQDLRYKNGNVLFSAPDLDNNRYQTLYNYKLEEKAIYKTNQFGDYAALSPDLSDDGKLGYCVVDFDNTFLRVKDYENIFIPLNADSMDRDYEVEDDTIVGKEGGPVLDRIPKINYKVEKYSPLKHLINFHSWYPSSGFPRYSAYIVSNDKLDKLSMILNPEFNVNDKSFSLGTYIKYGGLYPVFSLGYVPRLNIHSEVDGKEEVKSNNQLKASISVPLSYTRLNWQKRMNIKLDYIMEGNSKAFNLGFNNSVRRRMDFNFAYSNTMKSSYRSIYPQMGIESSIKLGGLEFKNGVNEINAYTKLFFPGFFKNNSFRIRYGVLAKTGENFNPIENADYYYARGYKLGNFDRMVSGLKFDYSFPLLYPDIAISKFIFIKRLRANLYFDIDRFDMKGGSSYFKRSAGLEIIFDNVYFRSVTLPMGVGIDYLFDIEKNQSPFNFRFVFDF